MVKKDHAPNFPLKHAHKDMALAVDMAKEANVEFSIISQAEKVYKEAREDTDLNIADQDFSAVYETIHKKSDSEFSKKRMRDE
jgi:3-hydroxyisobutyrate dehydrogenase-like beta-hydroxyacid dehydrogenase